MDTQIHFEFKGKSYFFKVSTQDNKIFQFVLVDGKALRKAKKTFTIKITERSKAALSPARTIIMGEKATAKHYEFSAEQDKEFMMAIAEIMHNNPLPIKLK